MPSKDVFKLQDKRYAVDGLELQRRREAAGLTLEAFAARCGWSTSYQWKLENNMQRTVSDTARAVVESVLKEIDNATG